MKIFHILLTVLCIRLTWSQIIDVSCTVNTESPVAIINSKFVGVTFDAGNIPTPLHFRGLNFSSEKVITLAKGLSPSYLRIGGTTADGLTFDETGTDPDVNHTFTGKTWDIINQFVETVGWDLIFGVNALKRYPDGNWDPTNAHQLLRYTVGKNYQMGGFELGNEPNIYPNKYNVTVNATQLGRDFVNFKKLVSTFPQFNSTLILGPDVTGVTGYHESFFSDFFTGGGSKAVNVATFHHYYIEGSKATVETFTDTTLMDKLIDSIQTARNITKRTNPSMPVWLGETSSCYAGGAPDLSDTYLAGFLWLDKLGISAEYGIQGVLRQAFYARGSYPLIKADTFDPLPDYWLTLLYKRLVGDLVLKASSNLSDVRVYAHCVKRDNVYGYMPGSVVLYVLVTGDSMVSLDFPQFADQGVDVFWLEPVGNVTSQSVTLNGVLLELEEGRLPFLQYLPLSGDTLTLPGKTFGFLVFPSAGVTICKN